jgi:LuxR family transcriptional regulator
MDEWQKHQLKEMRFVDSDHSAFEKIIELATELGFDFCSFGLRAPVPITNPIAVVLSTYPKTFQQAYELANYVSIDPVVQHATSSMEMVVWTDESRFSRNPGVLSITRAAGIYSGISHPTRGAHGVASLLDLSGYNRLLYETEVEDKKARITWLAHIAHQSLAPLLVKQFMPTIKVKLSARELSVLRWTANGKTSCEIAEILRITERTVNFHINNTMDKFGVTTRTAAAVQAALLGLLE